MAVASTGYLPSGILEAFRVGNMAESSIQSNGSFLQNAHQLRVLVVEDSPVQQRAVINLLKQLGHAVSAANEGFEAISLVQRNDPYDVILMDCQMPLMDGFKAARFIKDMERPTSPQSVIIGTIDSATADECFRAGMDDFVSKPLSKANLEAILKRWLNEMSDRNIIRDNAQ